MTKAEKFAKVGAKYARASSILQKLYARRANRRTCQRAERLVHKFNCEIFTLSQQVQDDSVIELLTDAHNWQDIGCEFDPKIA